MKSINYGEDQDEIEEAFCFLCNSLHDSLADSMQSFFNITGISSIFSEGMGKDAVPQSFCA